ncbi:hypothetical protein B0I35DRAFT_456953 [Stachybotrys elegans]|uniref:Uncharacterized protein n=1 Tax=Stachybotrys elegans TaxID=80388 RepID=A0A8K0WXF1_9HYPO|nr:hypothetical protein B0I35DRAFT_456953 [Stachybotrys elegans]
MHLDHKLPWTTLASCFELVRMNKSKTPRCTNIFPAAKPTREKDVAYFRKKLCAVLQEFSTTERQKHEAEDMGTRDGDVLFSDEVLVFLESFYNLDTAYRPNSLRSNPLHKNHQSLQYWIKRAIYPDTNSPSYTTMDGDLADALKGLLIISTVAPDANIRNEASSAILRLALDPKVPLQHLDRIAWGHSCGVDTLGLSSLNPYMLLNVADRLREQGSKIGAWELQSFLSAASESLFDDDHPSHKLPHAAFLGRCGADSEWVQNQKDVAKGNVHPSIAGEPIMDPLVDRRAECQQYLSVCFGMLYRYDMLRRICFNPKN